MLSHSDMHLIQWHFYWCFMSANPELCPDTTCILLALHTILYTAHYHFKLLQEICVLSHYDKHHQRYRKYLFTLIFFKFIWFHWQDLIYTIEYAINKVMPFHTFTRHFNVLVFIVTDLVFIDCLYPDLKVKFVGFRGKNGVFAETEYKIPDNVFMSL